MDPRLLQYYNKELQHVREMGAEFARAYPKIAARLALDGIDCADPYVERLLEGFGFLAARIQLKLDAEFPRFTQHLLEVVYPHYLAPTPSMTVVRFEPDRGEGALAGGVTIPRDTPMRSTLGRSEQTACEFRTAHDVTLWPIEVAEAEYFTHARGLSSDEIGNLEYRSGIRLRLRTMDGQPFKDLALDRLQLFLRGADELPMNLYEQLLGRTVGMVVRPGDSQPAWSLRRRKECVQPLGFREDEGLLPYDGRSFHGYRLLHEYFSFPQRFLFVEIGGLEEAVQRCEGTELDIIVLASARYAALEGAIDQDNFQLFCAPAVNLFPRRADRIHLKRGVHDFQVVPDRTRPLDFEVYRVEGITGYGAGNEAAQEFLPFYRMDARRSRLSQRAFFTVNRMPRVVSDQEHRRGTRSNYSGSEVFVSLVDADEAPYSSELKQLSVETLCTNRDLPMLMSVGQGRADFSLLTGAPVQSIRCVAGPTKPRGPWVEGSQTWRLISHLSLNYLSLIENDQAEGAEALRELLALYAPLDEASVQKQVEGVEAVRSTPVIRRLPVEGPIAFGRGLEVEVTLDDRSFEGTGTFLLGAVLDRFFAKYVSINSFTETVLRSSERGEVMRWPTRGGRRHLL